MVWMETIVNKLFMLIITMLKLYTSDQRKPQGFISHTYSPDHKATSSFALIIRAKLDIAV